jgi:hypothetical protein
MRRFSLPLTRLVHENLAIIMCFAYSRKPLEMMVQAKFKGEWKYLNKALFEISAQQAEKACVELALFLRTLDDEDEISAYHKATKRIPECGTVCFRDGSKEVMTFREVTNKIIHAGAIEWDLLKNNPMLVCRGRDQDRWIRAEVDLIAFAAVCGQLMS